MESQTVSKSMLSLFDSVVNENPMPIPVSPMALDDYRKMTHKQKESISEKLFQNEEISEYQEKKWRAELYNRDCYIFITEILGGKWGDQGQSDNAKRHALEVKKEQFERAILNNPYPFESLRLKIQPKKTDISYNLKIDWDE